MKQKLVRDIHRDFGYFYVGLIISFAFSGILMNHREHWHPEKYTIETKNIKVQLPEESQITRGYLLARKGVKGDKNFCIKTSVMKEFLIPEHDDTKWVPEGGILWLELDKKI